MSFCTRSGCSNSQLGNLSPLKQNASNRSCSWTKARSAARSDGAGLALSVRSTGAPLSGIGNPQLGVGQHLVLAIRAAMAAAQQLDEAVNVLGLLGADGPVQSDESPFAPGQFVKGGEPFRILVQPFGPFREEKHDPVGLG